MKTFLILSLLATVLTGNMQRNADKNVLSADKNTQYNIGDSTTLNGQWFLQPVLAADSATGKLPTLNFQTKAGKFTGNTACNNIRGSFQKTDTSLVFGQDIISTKMACTGYDEAAFMRNLLRTNRYKIEEGVLILMFDATELSRWTRKPGRSFKINRA